MDMGEPEPEEEEPAPPIEFQTTSRGRKIPKRTYVETTSEDDGHAAQDLFNDNVRVKRQPSEEDEDEDEAPIGRYPLRHRKRPLDGFIVSDEDDKMNSNARYSMRSRTKKPPPKPNGSSSMSQRPPGPSQRTRRLTRRNARIAQEEDIYVHNTSSAGSADADGSIDDAPHESSDLELEPEPEPEPEPEEEGDGKPYALRQRQKINYAIPPPLEEMPKPPPKQAGGRNGRSGQHHGKSGKGRGLGWSASGAELGRWMGMGGDDSVWVVVFSISGWVADAAAVLGL